MPFSACLPGVASVLSPTICCAGLHWPFTTRVTRMPVGNDGDWSGGVSDLNVTKYSPLRLTVNVCTPASVGLIVLVNVSVVLSAGSVNPLLHAETVTPTTRASAATNQ